MPVTVRPNPFHPTRDIAVLQEPWTADEVRAAVRANDRPLTQKAVPGTSKHQRLLAAGATIYQQCPPLELDAAAEPVKQWCREHHTLPVHSLEDRGLLELWVIWYEVIHQSWSPTPPRGDLADLCSDLVREIDPVRSLACSVDGEIVAVAFCFPGDKPPEILTEALLPSHPYARAAVASCMAAALAPMDCVVRFDGHVSDPHFAPLWGTVPGVYAGETDPLDLLQISA